MLPGPEITHNSTMSKKIKVILAAGSSGGHIFPALGLYEHLIKRNLQVEAMLVIPSHCVNFKSGYSDLVIKKISTTNISKKISVANLLAAWNLIRSFLESFFILVFFKPDVVIGFGTLCSVPVVMLSWFFRIKTVLHEQNVCPGLANRIMSKFVDKVAVSFPESIGLFPCAAEKVFVTGNPLVNRLKKVSRKEGAEFFNLSSDKFTILVMGGSQGSQAVNRLFADALIRVVNKDKLQVIHLSGRMDRQYLDKKYENSQVEVRVKCFLDEMYYAYSCADLAITRAGAATLAELIFYKIPAIVIPYPYARKHQDANAEVLRKKGCVVVMPEENISEAVLSENINTLMSDSGALSRMKGRYGTEENEYNEKVFGDIVLSL